MPLIVQKFGGTSVADADKIRAAARRAVLAAQKGNQVVMVVSAMGKNTDQLVDLASQVNDRPPAREMDMLLSTGEQVSVALMAMAIHAMGHKAVSLTGAQIGIRTDNIHTKARIKSISTERVQRLLDEGNIVIAAGFQGIDENYDITTLGRGGSDTTAVALAAVLQADVCEIYTDVEGVFTTDPRVIPEAGKIDCIGYDEMFELASLGAGVMHSRSIEFGKKYQVPIHVRSSFSDSTGTMIVDDRQAPRRAVTGAAYAKDEARISVFGVPDVPGTSQQIFSRLANRAISIDMIVQNVGGEGKADISFTVPRSELTVALEEVDQAVRQLGSGEVTHDDNVSKVSIVGTGMAEQTGVADKAFRALAEAGVNIEMITTSEIKISVLVDRIDSQLALRALHAAFGLADMAVTCEVCAAPEAVGAVPVSRDALDVVERLRGLDMEQLIIDDISLDQDQALITIGGVPDEPGVAAGVFDHVAAAGIFVDMIVQSYGQDQTADLSLTVPKDQYKKALESVKKLTEKFRSLAISGNDDVAKLSVSGIGLHSRTDVAIRMFRVLAERNINVEMISTSEVRVNVVVAGRSGPAALECFQQVFADSIK